MDTSKAHLLIFQLPFKGNTRRFHQRIFSSNNFSSTSFVFNETRIVLINRYGATIIKFDTTYTIYISVCVYMGRGNCPSSGLLLSGVVVVRGGVVRGRCPFPNLINTCIQGRPFPPETMMHFPPCFRFPPILEQFSDSDKKFHNLTFSRKISLFSSSEISDDLFWSSTTNFEFSPYFLCFSTFSWENYYSPLL